jgi:hypothetical protein
MMYDKVKKVKSATMAFQAATGFRKLLLATDGFV